jgi:hypothetical protein
MKTTIITSLAVLAIDSHAFAADRLVPSQYATIQAAIDAAANGDVVQVSPGSYAGPIDTKGKAITVRGTADAATTIVSGGDSVLKCIANEGATTVIENLTFTNGDGSRGAGVLILGSSPVIRQCRIVSNVISSGSQQGAGVYIEGGAPAVQSCLIAANTINVGYGLGAGVCIVNSTGVISDCLISGNLITGWVGNSCGGGRGAGVYITGPGPARLERCTIASNQNSIGASGCCQSAGPGITFDGPATVTNCVIRENAGAGCGSTAAVQFNSTAVYVQGTRICGNVGSTQTYGAYVSLGGNTVSTTCPGCSGDLNNDGKVDGADLGLLLSNWGWCPN